MITSCVERAATALVAVKSMRESWRSATSETMSYGAVMDAGRIGAKGIGCRVGESIFDREVKNLSRGSDTYVNEWPQNKKINQYQQHPKGEKTTAELILD